MTAPDDGPECDLCGKTDCPDADLAEFSEPVACTYAPIYHDLRHDRCEYGCGRDITKETIRRDIVPAVERILTARVAAAEVRALREVADETYTHTTIGQNNKRTKTERPVLSADVRAFLNDRADRVAATQEPS